MLVKVIDHKGKPRYINAMYVRQLHQKGDTKTDIEIAGAGLRVRVDLSPDAVAELLNAAMPTGMEALIADLEAQNQQQQAASAAG